MVSKWTPEAKVGIITLMAVIVGFYFISNLEIFRRDTGEYYKVRVYFKNVTGLLNNADVRLNGIRVGRVTDIKLDAGRAIVTLEVMEDAMIRRNDSISLATMGVMGEKYVDIMPGDRVSPLVRDDAVPMEGHDSIGFEELGVSINVVLKSFQHISENLQEVTESFSDVLGNTEGRQMMSEILSNTRDLTYNLSYITGAENKELAGILKNINEITESLNKTLPSLIHKFDQMAGTTYDILEKDKDNISNIMNNLEQLSANLNLVSENVAGSSRHIETITENVSSGKGSVGKLLMEDETIDNVNETLVSLQGISNDLHSIIKGAASIETYIGYDAEYNQKKDRFKSYVNIKIEPSDDVFYLIQLVNDPYGLETYTTKILSIDGPGGETQYTHSEKKIENILRFSLLYNKRITDFLYLKAGLMESYAGIGADLVFLGDNLRIGFDAWDFANEEYDPHYKISLNYRPMDNIFFRVGYDNIMNSERRSLVFGAGLNFRDDHIKSLLGLLSLGSIGN